MAEFVIGKFGFLIINFFLVLTKESKKSKKILEPMGLLKKCQPIGSSRSANYREHMYECLVLL